MAPRKTAEKPQMETLGVKPRQSVRKKSLAQGLAGTKLKTPAIIELSIPGDNSHDAENVTGKITKPKTAKRVNGMKPTKVCKGITDESCDPHEPTKSKKAKMAANNTNISPNDMSESPKTEEVLLKYKKPKLTNKLNDRQAKKTPSDEATDVLFDLEDVLPKNKIIKVARRQYKKRSNITHLEEANETLEPAQMPKKIQNTKTPKVNKQVQNQIHISYVIDEVTDESCKPEEVSIKNTRTKTCKQSPDKIKIIIAKEGGTHVSTQQLDIPEGVRANAKKAKMLAKEACKQNQNEIKIMLANEVVRSAFEKKPKILREVSRPGRRRKVVRKRDNNTQDANNDPTTKTDAHEHIQDVAKKRAVQPSGCNKRSLPLLTEEILPVEDGPQRLATLPNASPVKETPKKRKKLSLKRNKSKPVTDATSQNDAVEGKEKVQESPIIDSNASLTNSKESAAPDSTTKTKTGKPRSRQSSRITCRKNSNSSLATCLSWTKDISSSSTSTCVTVKSNDFVRIDKKVPIVKLTNIEHEIKSRHTVDSIIEDNSFDSHQELSKCPSECSSDTVSNLNVSQTLNLSTSSLTSVTTNKTKQNHDGSIENKNEAIIKLRRNLENLSNKMKKFDFEIINWIGYQNEGNDTNAKNFHAKIFEVLKEENEIIKYCKQCKHVLTGRTSPLPNQLSTCSREVDVSNHEAKDVESNPSKDIQETANQCASNLEKDVGSTKDDDTKDPDINKMFHDISSLDKDIDDDDDALSLFAESITGLESSRKNSSFANSVCNDKSIVQPDLRDVPYVNANLSQHDNAVQVEPTLRRVINLSSVKKQTADSSTLINRSNSNTFEKSETNYTGNNVYDRHIDKPNVNCSSVSFKHKDKNGISTINKCNRSLFDSTIEFPDIQIESQIDVPENYSDRSSEFQNYTSRGFTDSFENGSFDFSKNISGITTNNSEYQSNIPNDIQGANKESFHGVQSMQSNPAIEHFKDSIAHQLTMANKHIIASNIFKGICIFNLIGNCKNVICTFSHKQIDVDFLRSKLRDLDQDMFIMESKFLLKWLMLKRKYGMCFIEECIRRNMTMRLLEIVKEFITKMNRNNREEKLFAVEVVESSLLHLNEADMAPCADLLRLEMKWKRNTCICDYFMEVISETQNFSRFKNVFIKLTLFICKIGRSFRLDVATQLLERLCILPYDDALARALMKIIQNTNPSIFSVSMMSLLESQLSKNNPPLYKELMSLKQQAERNNQCLLSPPMQSPRVASSDVAQSSTPAARADSPDTTNMDSGNITVEPVITRTITRTIDTSNLNLSTGSDSSEEPRKKYEWRNLERSWRCYPVNTMSLRPQRHVYHRPGFAPRGFKAHPRFQRINHMNHRGNMSINRK